MVDENPDDRGRVLAALRPLAPLRPRRWLGFPSVLAPIGRSEEIAALGAVMREPRQRLVTLTGPGGVGKTRLALAVAEEVAPTFADGAAFVALAALSDPALILPAIAEVLELRETPERSPRELVIWLLRERNLLLVLDNFEHLVGEAAVADLAALYHACPGVHFLVTSRIPLHLHDERRFVTPPLALPAADADIHADTVTECGAVALFVERARMAHSGFVLTGKNAPAVVEICRRLDGLPLAIELAAAWVRVLPPGALLEQLEPRLALLRDGAVDQPVRLRTMRNAIAWSYALLSDEEQRLFRRLAVFVGGFTIEAVAAVFSGERGKGGKGEVDWGERGKGGKSGPHRASAGDKPVPKFTSFPLSPFPPLPLSSRSPHAAGRQESGATDGAGWGRTALLATGDGARLRAGAAGGDR